LAREAQTPFLIEIEADSGRLDVFLQKNLPHLSRSSLQNHIRSGHIKVNGELVKTGYALEAGDRIEISGNIEASPVAVKEPRPEAPIVPLEVLYEDEAVLVVNKPAGLVVHPGSGTKGQATLAASVVAYLSGKHLAEPLPGDPERPGVVHRLDKDTSGVMVFAKTAHAHRGLSKQFKDKTNLREYVALLDGVMKEDEIPVTSYLYRDPRYRVKFASLSCEEYEQMKEEGRELQAYRYAKTFFHKRKVYGQRLTLAVMSLETGRTHQIRVHARTLGVPVWADKVYGYTPRLPQQFPSAIKTHLESVGRHLLHARRLGFEHPVDGRKLAFEAPLPSDFRAVLELLEKHSQV
jgi:23S rRNA pseudouridine1911/1915/1917 synthase